MPVTGDKTRIVSPAEISATPCTPWPNGAFLNRNVSFRGPNLPGMKSESGGRCDLNDGGRGTCAWQQDMSWLNNIPHWHDFFLHHLDPDVIPHITHVADDGLAVLHSHPPWMQGTKFFTWGEQGFGRFQQDFMSASDYENKNCSDLYYDPWCEAYENEGQYTELQVCYIHHRRSVL